MKRHRSPSTLLLIVPVSVCLTAIAAESPKTASAALPAGTQARPLKDPIRVSPGSQRGVIGKRILPEVSFDKLDQKFTEFSGNAKAYESGAKAMPEIAKQCAAKSYSVQDQKAAGCTGTDTLNQCMDKLYKHCIENYSFSGLDLGLPNQITGESPGKVPSFSTKQFQQSAKTAAAQARVLSQLLNQFANEAEQNAKALVP